MEKVDKTNNQIVFKSDLDETIVNSIRRYLNRILVMAVDELEISKNDSPLYDETLAHRVGLIPLETAGTTVESSPGELTLSVKKKGVVYSGDLKGKPAPVYDKIPITTLDKDQEVTFTATVRSGTGKEHSKFSPGIMFYRHVTELIMDKSLLEEIKKVCPEDQIKEKGDKIIIVDDGKKEIADVCEGIANKKGKKAEVNEKKDLIVTIESFGQMAPEKMFNGSLDVLKKDLKELEKEISKSK